MRCPPILERIGTPSRGPPRLVAGGPHRGIGDQLHRSTRSMGRFTPPPAFPENSAHSARGGVLTRVRWCAKWEIASTWKVRLACFRRRDSETVEGDVCTGCTRIGRGCHCAPVWDRPPRRDNPPHQRWSPRGATPDCCLFRGIRRHFESPTTRHQRTLTAPGTGRGRAHVTRI
jgi:hypothetical protein